MGPSGASLSSNLLYRIFIGFSAFCFAVVPQLLWILHRGLTSLGNHATINPKCLKEFREFWIINLILFTKLDCRKQSARAWVKTEFKNASHCFAKLGLLNEIHTITEASRHPCLHRQHDRGRQMVREPTNKLNLKDILQEPWARLSEGTEIEQTQMGEITTRSTASMCVSMWCFSIMKEAKGTERERSQSKGTIVGMYSLLFIVQFPKCPWF